MSFVHRVRVRYGECDMQKVVFNPNYWVYCDDAVDVWVRRALAVETGTEATQIDFTSVGFDFMLKSCTGLWHRGAEFGESLELDCTVSRWGNTSFDVSIEMRASDQPCFDATIVYVSVDPTSHRPVPVPDLVRRGLSRDLRP